MWQRSRSWEPGTWPPRTDRPRVLLEDPDGAILSASERFLRQQGFDVAECRGPEGMGGRRCPMVTGGTCSLAAGADVIYLSMDVSVAENSEVLRAHRRDLPDTPVVVEICKPDEPRFGELLTGCQVVHIPSGTAKMVAAIRGALATTATT